LVGEAVDASHLYFGIPYAAPPMGDLHWRAPALAPSWSGVRDARRYGAVCPQRSALGIAGSEDCLSVNVTAPGGRRTARSHRYR